MMATETLSAEDKQLQSMLQIDLTGLEDLGKGDSDFDKPVTPPPEAKRPPPSAPIPAKSVSTDPFSRALGRMHERNPVYKASLLKDHQEAVNRMREIYDALCLGEMDSLGKVREVAAALMENFRRDPPATLALSLARAPTSDDYMYRHAVNVSLLTMATATAAGFSKTGVLEAGMASLIADVGMRLVPEEILSKNGKLTEEELAEIQKHPHHSKGLLSRLKDAETPLIQVALQHHERLTGAGYPARLAATDIIPTARMMAIADTLAAMVHKRSHRDAMSPQAALDRVLKMSQMNFLEFELVKGLVGFLSVFPVGSLVEISLGRIGRVVEAHPADPARPVVAVVKDASGILAMKAVFLVDLLTVRTEKILRCLDAEVPGLRPLDGF